MKFKIKGQSPLDRIRDLLFQADPDCSINEESFEEVGKFFDFDKFGIEVMVKGEREQAIREELQIILSKMNLSLFLNLEGEWELSNEGATIEQIDELFDLFNKCYSWGNGKDKILGFEKTTNSMNIRYKEGRSIVKILDVVEGGLVNIETLQRVKRTTSEFESIYTIQEPIKTFIKDLKGE